MRRAIISTKDGSHTVQVPGWNVTYHSHHGAIQESMHVFIEAGLVPMLTQPTSQPLHIFEMGFGTGLNAFLTAIEAGKHRKPIHYTAIEQFPLSKKEASELNYPTILHHNNLFQKIHECGWKEDVPISDFFTLRKENADLVNYSTDQQFNLVYYDAFAPSAQPELWTEKVFQKLFSRLAEDGMLVTYCSKGDVRRAMKAAGFTVEKLPGPRGKREMVRATRASL